MNRGLSRALSDITFISNRLLHLESWTSGMVDMSDVQQGQAEVRNNRTRNRFELSVEGDMAIADYVASPNGVLTFTHTFTPPALRGRGIAARLIHGALEQVRAEGLKVVPQCWYVADYIRDHPQFADLLARR